MTEQEKAIKGMELCLTPVDYYEDGTDVCHDDCPYFRDYAMGDCLRAMCRDALALLKAQEPRVMTVADIVDNYDAPEVVWVEARNNNGDIRLVAGLWNGEYYNMADDSIMYDLGEEIANNPEGYNTRWRCWTSRPDEKRRAETPWAQTSG